MVRILLGVIVGLATTMLVVQVHVLNIHLSNFSNNPVDQYMEQQMKFPPHPNQQHQKQGQVHRNRIQQDMNYTLIDGDVSIDDLGPILHILGQAGYNISDDREIRKKSLPSWSKIVEAYGEPTVLGLETCKQFRDSVDPSLRNLGVAGLFNSGALKQGILVSYTNFFSHPLRHKSTIQSLESKLWKPRFHSLVQKRHSLAGMTIFYNCCLVL
jgi:hypothetical protein